MSALQKHMPREAFAQLELTAKFFRGLGDPTRLRILELLLERDRPVTELVTRLKVQQGRVSNHLACLKWCGYVTTRRGGKYIYYRIADGRVRDILELARGMVSENADHIAACMRIGSPSERGR